MRRVEQEVDFTAMRSISTNIITNFVLITTLIGNSINLPCTDALFAPVNRRSSLNAFPLTSWRAQAQNRVSAYHNKISPTAARQNAPKSMRAMMAFPSESIAFIDQFNLNISADQAEVLAGPFFGISLFPYLAFLYFLNVKENETPKGTTSFEVLSCIHIAPPIRNVNDIIVSPIHSPISPERCHCGFRHAVTFRFLIYSSR